MQRGWGGLHRYGRGSGSGVWWSWSSAPWGEARLAQLILEPAPTRGKGGRACRGRDLSLGRGKTCPQTPPEDSRLCGQC